jgi:hypothetical protein
VSDVSPVASESISQIFSENFAAGMAGGIRVEGRHLTPGFFSVEGSRGSLNIWNGFRGEPELDSLNPQKIPGGRELS